MSNPPPPPYSAEVKQPMAGYPAAAQPAWQAQAPAAYPAQAPTAYPAQVQPQQIYVAQPAQQTVVINRQIRPQSYGFGYGYYQYIPVLHMAPAIICLVLNVVGLGLGSCVAAFCLLCCGHTYSTTQSKGEVFFWCFGAGFLQLCLCFFSALGWVWAIFWGALFVSMSSQFYGRPFTPVQSTTTTTVITA
eukprot:scpid42504/ scgid11018/ 